LEAVERRKSPDPFEIEPRFLDPPVHSPSFYHLAYPDFLHEELWIEF
jgi:hypothetical protein